MKSLTKHCFQSNYQCQNVESQLRCIIEKHTNKFTSPSSLTKYTKTILALHELIWSNVMKINI